MNYKLKYFILKIQEYSGYIVRSKVFLYGVFVILLGLVVAGFSIKSKKIVSEDFYYNDTIEIRGCERLFTEETNISMPEIHRISKLLSFFFNDIIVNKAYEIKGISEFYEDVKSYDMQILSASKAGSTYEVLVVVGIPDEEYDELCYKPYKKYEVIVDSTGAGLKVDYINIIDDEEV